MSRLVDCAWDTVLHDATPQEVAAIRLVSQGWREDVGRALDSLHVVDPTPHMLTSMGSQLPRLLALSITLTHDWNSEPLSTPTHASHQLKHGEQWQLQQTPHLKEGAVNQVQSQQPTSGFLPWLCYHHMHLLSSSSSSSNSSSRSNSGSSSSDSSCAPMSSSCTQACASFPPALQSALQLYQDNPHHTVRAMNRCTQLALLRELSVQGWAGTCTACKQRRHCAHSCAQSSALQHSGRNHSDDGPLSSSSDSGNSNSSSSNDLVHLEHTSSSSSSCSSSSSRAMGTGMLPLLPTELLQWASCSQQLRTLRLMRCALPRLDFLQAYRQLQELHLVNIAVYDGYEAPNANGMDVAAGEGAGSSILVQQLLQLPQLHTLVVRLQGLGLQHQAMSLQGISSLQQLSVLQLCGAATLLLDVARQVPSCPQLQSLTLEAAPQTDLSSGLAVTFELQLLLATMQPGSTTLQRLEVLGHTHTEDRDLQHIHALFPSLTHVSLPLSSLATSMTAWGHPPGGITLEGIHPLLVKHVPCHNGAAAHLSSPQQEQQQSLSVINPQQTQLRHQHRATSPCAEPRTAGPCVPTSMQPLQGLQLAHIPLTVDVLHAVCMHSSLQELDLSGCQHVDDSTMYYLTSAARLVKLGLSRCKALTDIGLAQLAARAHQLTYLDISHTGPHISNLGISRLSMLHQLSHLNLAACHKLCDQGMAGLLSHPQQPCPLQSLTLSHCHRLTDVTLNLLAQRAVRLTRIVLDGVTLITPSGVMQLAALKHLRSVSLAWCDAAVQAASSQLADSIWGARIGPLCTIPPGRIEAVATAEAEQACKDQHMPLAGTSVPPACTLSSHEAQCSTASIVDKSQYHGAGCSPQQKAHLDVAERSNSNSNSLVSSSSCCSGEGVRAGGKHQRHSLKFCASHSVIGFGALDEPTTVLPASCWWMEHSM